MDEFIIEEIFTKIDYTKSPAYINETHTNLREWFSKSIGLVYKYYNIIGYENGVKIWENNSEAVLIDYEIK